MIHFTSFFSSFYTSSPMQKAFNANENNDNGSNKKNVNFLQNELQFFIISTENWYMAPTLTAYLPNYCRSVWAFLNIYMYIYNFANVRGIYSFSITIRLPFNTSDDHTWFLLKYNKSLNNSLLAYFQRFIISIA